MLSNKLHVTRDEVMAENGMVAAGHRLEVETGRRMLQKGGNAVDAAVAGAFVAELAEPAMCGLGGHGVMSVYMADTGETTVIDFYDVAPAGAFVGMYELLDDKSGHLGALGFPGVKDDAQSVGHRSVMVPGQVAGLCAAHERYGSLPLEDVMAPAIELAENGLPVDGTTVRYIVASAALIRRFPATAACFLRDGLPPRAGSAPWDAGDTLVRKDLAETLRRIAREGSQAFYKGEIAQAIAAGMAANDGLITLEDLANYEPYLHPAERYTYRGYEYVTGGNVTLVEALNILECFDLGSLGAESTLGKHLMIEAMRRAWADTLMYVGDPRRDTSPWKGLTSKAYARQRAAEIDLTKASPEVGPGDPWAFEGRPCPGTYPWPIENMPPGSGNTTKVAAIDARGNIVSLITSLGFPFASKVTVPGTGVLLNNSMHRLDPRPGYLNSIEPGKGMQRLTAAVLVFKDGRPFAALGGSLSIFIGGMGLHPIVNMIDLGMGVQEAIETYRFHPVGEITWLDDRIPEAVQRDLAAMGHRILPLEEKFGETHFGNHVGIHVAPETTKIHGGGDPFHANAVAGY
jgi:gamma-glutamyltranspeptidase/glutathione hydrolase